MAFLAVACARVWSLTAFIFTLADAQAFPLSLHETAGTRLFAVAPQHQGHWPSYDPSSIYGDGGPPSPMAKSSTRGRLANGRLHFVTYSLPGYEQAMNDLCHEAHESGFFSGVHCFEGVPDVAMEGRWNALRRKKDVQVEWLYQPAMVQHLLRKVIPPGDTMLFGEATVDMSRNLTNWQALVDLIEGNQKADIIAFQRSDTPEYIYTKADVFREFGVWMSDVEVTSYQISASYFVAKNNRPVHLFVTKWADLLAETKLLTDQASHAPNHEGFLEHHHENSLWSMLVKANRPGSKSRHSHRIKDLSLRILPYSGCDDLRQVPNVPIQAHCERHRKSLKERLRKEEETNFK